MKILLTNHHLLDYTGSEIFLFTIAKWLQKKSMSVTVYSKFVDRMRPLFVSLGIPVVENLEEISGEAFDIAHVHHNISALEVRYYFPKLPIIFLSHGTKPFLEHPPTVDVRISKFLAVSEEVQNNLIKHFIPNKKSFVYRNIIDSKLFFPSSQINSQPQRALVLSRKIDLKSERMIKAACSRLNIATRFVGGRFGEIDYLTIPYHMRDADIVFTSGRGVIEAMMCGRIPLIIDSAGSDGLVTPGNFEKLMSCNFSGRYQGFLCNESKLIQEVTKYYAPHGSILRDMAMQFFDAESKIDVLIDLYKTAAKLKIQKLTKSERDLLDTFIKTIKETSYYSYVKSTRMNETTKSLGTQILQDAEQHYVHILEQALLQKRKRITTLDFIAKAKHEVVYYFDFFKQFKNYVKLEGWAYLKGISSANNQIFVLLISDRNSYIFEVSTIKRPDVTSSFKEFNYDHSGFSISIPYIVLDRNEYDVFLYLKKGKIRGVINTLQKIYL